MEYLVWASLVGARAHKMAAGEYLAVVYRSDRLYQAEEINT